MEHFVNIEEEVVPVPSEVVNKADPSGNLPADSSGVSSENVPIHMIRKTMQFMNEKIHGLPPLVHEPCIFRVHEGLRKGNEEAYTPKLVSIGPYHHKTPKLGAMEEHKLRYFHSLLRRINNNDDTNINTSMERYLLLMEKLADKARGYYADPIGLERDKFVQMMLLDACFIIEFLRKRCFRKLRDQDDPIFKSSWMKLQIYRDLMLLENQIPFFVLSQLFDKTDIPNSNNVPLVEMALFPISYSLPNQKVPTKMLATIIDNTSAGESMHFLDLVHRFYLPSSRENCDSSAHQKYCAEMPCVTELEEAGISFKVSDSDDVNIFDISFDHSHMKIPKFEVTDGTEIFLRNIVAYEQHSSSVNIKYFSDYHFFMDFLINTEKDVNALRLNGIINNWLGDDKEVALMINNLGDGVIIGQTFYYSHVCQKVKEHCEKPWNKAKAKLKHNYFNNPWASISTAAAGVLLSLTLMHTVVALIDLLANRL